MGKESADVNRVARSYILAWRTRVTCRLLLLIDAEVPFSQLVRFALSFEGNHNGKRDPMADNVPCAYPAFDRISPLLVFPSRGHQQNTLNDLCNAEPFNEFGLFGKCDFYSIFSWVAWDHALFQAVSGLYNHNMSRMETHPRK